MTPGLRAAGPGEGMGLRIPTRPGRTPAQRVRLLGLRLIGRFYARSPQSARPRSILLIRPDHLGDVLFLTPALRALRQARPDARITALLGPWSAAVLRDNPDVDEIRTCRFPGFERRPKAGGLVPYRYLLESARDLRGAGYDTAVVLRCDHWWGAWLAAAAGIARRLGFGWPETRPFLTQALPYESGRHEVEQNGRLLAALAAGGQVPPGPERPGPLRFEVTDADRAWAAAWLAAHGAGPASPLVARPLVAIHPGAGAAVKQWDTSSWAAVAEALMTARGAQVLVTGSAGERALAEAIAAGLTGGALNAAGETSLGQLAALQERCNLVLGSDCGPLHLAVAVGTPTLALFGPVSAVTFGPWGDPRRHVVLTSRWTCASCNRLDWPAEALPQHRCMAAIEVDDVIHAAVGLLPG